MLALHQDHGVARYSLFVLLGTRNDTATDSTTTTTPTISGTSALINPTRQKGISLFLNAANVDRVRLGTKGPTTRPAQLLATRCSTRRYHRASLLDDRLAGFAVTAYSVVRMMQSQRAGDGIGCVHWQRIRVLASALSISLLTTPLVLPHLSRSSILFRTTPTI